MNEFKIPFRELKAKFTKSEMAIMGWQSQESVAELEKSSSKLDTQNLDYKNEIVAPEVDDKYMTDGEVDIRKLTGNQAAKMFSKMGLHFTPIVK
jgi:hypothetical protein